MPRPVFREERCKGCGLCIVVCPKKILEIGAHVNSRGYFPATCVNEKNCIGCMLCAKACPDIVIEIHKE